MKFSVKSFFLWILISSATANNEYLRSLLEAEVPRVRRSGTTVCVEVKPTSSQQEPYYMCKGGEAPSVQPTATFRPFASAKSLPTIKPRSSSGFEATRDVSTPATFGGYRGQSVLGQQPIYSFRPQTFNEFNLQRTNEQSSLAFADPNQQVWAIPRLPQQTIQTQPVLQPALPTERALELHAQNAPYFVTTEKPFQTLQTQSRPNEFASFGTQKDHYRYAGQEQAPNSYIARQRHGYSEQDQRSAYRSQYFGEPSQSSGYRYSSAPEYDSPVTNEQYPYVFPTTLDQLVTMDRPTYEPFTGVARPNTFQTGYDNNRQFVSDQDLSFGDVDFAKTPNDFPPNLIVDMTPEELRKILIQPTVPAEIMSDPVMRNFYSSLEDQNALERTLQGLLKEKEKEFNENPPTTKFNNKQTAKQPETKSDCPSCERNTDDILGSFNVEKVSSQAPCANSKDYNWPPVVIAMPCCGQQTNTPSTPPLPAAGFYNPYAMPMMGMYPSLMTPYNTVARENTNYAQAYQHQNYQNLPQMSGGQNRAANPETQMPETTTVKTTSENPKTEISITEKSTKAPEEVTESTTQKITTMELKTDIPNTTAETTTTTESNFEEDVTDLAEAADTLKPKDDIPKTFQTMLNRAKTFKELAEAEMKDETLNHDAKKGKRQNFKDANAALRTIAEVVAASNKRKYSTVIH